MLENIVLWTKTMFVNIETILKRYEYFGYTFPHKSLKYTVVGRSITIF